MQSTDQPSSSTAGSATGVGQVQGQGRQASPGTPLAEDRLQAAAHVLAGELRSTGLAGQPGAYLGVAQRLNQQQGWGDGPGAGTTFGDPDLLTICRLATQELAGTP